MTGYRMSGLLKRKNIDYSNQYNPTHSLNDSNQLRLNLRIDLDLPHPSHTKLHSLIQF